MEKKSKEILKTMIQEFVDKEDGFTSGVRQFYKEINEILRNEFGCDENGMLVTMGDALEMIPQVIDFSQTKGVLLP